MPDQQHLLVVDDDDAIRRLIFTVLRRRGFQVDTARDGSEALDRCQHQRYSVVILDLMMPRMTGYEFLERVRALSLARPPLVVVLTAGNEPRNLDPTLVAGILRKPFDINLLMEMVSGCLSASATAPSCEAHSNEVDRANDVN